MRNLQAVDREHIVESEAPARSSSLIRLIVQWTLGILVAFALGTWLVWWGAHLHRTFAMDDIRSACQRVMPETFERCVDTVIIQRGGARR
ncbi:hypothetical protein W02_04060 [Nitrospira sp. KM1]|uniref:hypothetical protein n=1 Tax=Nitrospira sp. KM1 TaxID=1936990 RepID=UPI0013A72A83|nr:hypothetical protein [Nitrospira sp. KM1]BCA53266.1 hypothetical protein W02_04060 [Nitrospira sp. KM1]